MSNMIFKNLFLLSCVSAFIASMFSCQAMQDDRWDSRPSVNSTKRAPILGDQNPSAEHLFNTFLERSSSISRQIKQKQIRNLALTVLDFAALDCHYLETNNDTHQAGYKKILEEEYYPLLDNLVKLDSGEMKQTDFFTFVLNLYLKNLKDTSGLAKAARSEDDNLRSVKGTFEIYTPGKDMNFFRDPEIVPTCEAFLSEESIIKFWNPKTQMNVDRSTLRSGKGKLTTQLNIIKKDMYELKMRVLPYRTAIEEYFNTLLHQAWGLVTDRKQLSNKTKSVLNEFEYIWTVLKSGYTENQNYDPLIKEFTFSKSGQLPKVFALNAISDDEFANENVELRKELMPTKKKKKKKKKAGIIPLVEDQVITPQLPPETVKEVTPEQTQMNEKIESPVVQKKDPKPAVVIKQKTEIVVPKLTNQDLFDEVRATKHIQYVQITKLFKDLNGVKVRTNGSHETWEFKVQSGKTVSFGFWYLHGKDQYGPWTKKYILSLEQKLQD